MTSVFIGLGGNSPGTLGAFSRTRLTLERILEKTAFSSLYKTAPLVDEDQDYFWNAVVWGFWAGTPEGLLERLLMIESREGRLRDPARPKGPRILDLDLLVFGAVVRNSSRLTLPHPGVSVRRFVLDPLVELSPLEEDPRNRVFWNFYRAALVDQGVDRSLRTW